MHGIRSVRSLATVAFLLWLFLGLPLLYRPALSAETTHDFAKWEPEIKAFEAMDKTNRPPRNALLFIGSSTVRLWKTLAEDFPAHSILNRGFGGSEILDATHFADRIISPYRPRMIFLRAGGNDIHAGKSPEQVFADFEEFAQAVQAKLPRTQVVYISGFPSIARLEQADRERKLNEMIAAYAQKNPRVRYVDAWDIPLGADGKPKPELFQNDKLHLNEAGYELLAERVRPFLPN